jgi:hypothetical protein
MCGIWRPQVWIRQGRLGTAKFLQFAAENNFAGAAAFALEPGLELGDFDAIESGLVPDFDAQGTEVKGTLAAPIGAAELAKSDDRGFIERLGGERDSVVDPGGVAEGDDALLGAERHKGSVAYSLFIRQEERFGENRTKAEGLVCRLDLRASFVDVVEKQGEDLVQAVRSTT